MPRTSSWFLELTFPPINVGFVASTNASKNGQFTLIAISLGWDHKSCRTNCRGSGRRVQLAGIGASNPANLAWVAPSVLGVGSRHCSRWNPRIGSELGPASCDAGAGWGFRDLSDFGRFLRTTGKEQYRQCKLDPHAFIVRRIMDQSFELHTDVLLKPSGGGAGGVCWRDGVVTGLEAASGKSVPCIVPAFVDPHVHLILGARHVQRADFSHCKSREDFSRCLDMAHRDQPDGWLIGGGWDAGRLESTPDRLWLEHVGDRPCVLWSRDIHVAVVNDAVLAQLDVSPIEGGCFHRDDTGQLTGRLDEAAAWHRLNPIIPEPSPSSDRFCVEQAVPLLHSRGILGVGSMEYFRHVESVLAKGVPGLDLSITLLDRSDEVDATSLRKGSTSMRTWCCRA